MFEGVKDWVWGRVEVFGYPLVGAVVRAVRTTFFVLVAGGLTWALENWGSLEVSTPVSTAGFILLLAADKYIRERRSESYSDDE